MKKHIMICLLAICFWPTLKAQLVLGDFRDRLTFGAKAGMNISNVWDSEGEAFVADANTGFATGIFFGLPFGTFLGFQPEVLLSQKGFQGSGTLFGSTYTVSRTTTYIDVPLQLQVKPTKFLALLVGPQYSFLVAERNTFTYGSNSIVQQEEFDNENIRRNSFGIVTGADFTLSHIVLSTKFGWDLLNNNGDGSSSTPRYKNRWIQLTAGFRI